MILKNTTTQGLKPNPQTGRGGATRRRKKQIPPASLRSRVGMTRFRGSERHDSREYGKSRTQPQPLKGAIEKERHAASRKRSPDTNRDFFGSSEAGPLPTFARPHQVNQ